MDILSNRSVRHLEVVEIMANVNNVLATIGYQFIYKEEQDGSIKYFLEPIKKDWELGER